MPTFDTPEPISAEITMLVGEAHIIASDRTDTVVTVSPSDASREPDQRIAEQTRVEYTAGRLLVKAPKQRALGLFNYNKAGSIDVTVELPAGSSLAVDIGVAGVRCTGPLGECHIKTGAGDVQVDQTGPLDLRTGAGGVFVDQVTGHAEISTGTGRLRVREINGTAVLKNSNGDVWVGTATGELRVNTANGAITVEHATAGVNANTANGDVRVGSITRGTTSLKTPAGSIEIGIPTGTAAHLDVHTGFGRIRNALDTTDDPGPAEDTAEVRARTSYGDIVIRRAEHQETDQHKENA